MKTLKGGISSFRYKKLNFFYKLYYKFMCFFNERFCIERNTTNPYNANKGKGITQKKHNGPNYIIPKTNANPYNANKGITQIHNIQGKPTRTNLVSNRKIQEMCFYMKIINILIVWLKEEI